MRQCYSHENSKEFVMISPRVMPRPIVSQIANANMKRQCEHETQN